MTSKTTRGFWTCFDGLPSGVQAIARKKYRLWVSDPFHPSLHFKDLATDLWSVRIISSIGRLHAVEEIWWCGFGSEHIKSTTG